MSKPNVFTIKLSSISMTKSFIVFFSIFHFCYFNFCSLGIFRVFFCCLAILYGLQQISNHNHCLSPYWVSSKSQYLQSSLGCSTLREELFGYYWSPFSSKCSCLGVAPKEYRILWNRKHEADNNLNLIAMQPRHVECNNHKAVEATVAAVNTNKSSLVEMIMFGVKSRVNGTLVACLVVGGSWRMACSLNGSCSSNMAILYGFRSLRGSIAD